MGFLKVRFHRTVPSARRSTSVYPASSSSVGRCAGAPALVPAVDDSCLRFAAAPVSPRARRTRTIRAVEVRFMDDPSIPPPGERIHTAADGGSSASRSVAAIAPPDTRLPILSERTRLRSPEKLGEALEAGLRGKERVQLTLG